VGEPSDRLSLGHQPEGRWRFDESVTDVFEDMLQRSIPGYAEMRRTVEELARRYVQPGTAVVDLGCSRGDALAPLVRDFGAHNQFVGVDASEPMVRAARERFDGMIRCGVVEIREMDLRTEYPSRRASVTLAVLTVQFVPIEYRQQILRRVYEHTVPGGALILVEKVLGADAETHRALTDAYHEHKEAQGYTSDEITRKRLSLEGVLVPVTAAWNEELLQRAGFQHIECIWRTLNFAGWLAVRAP
jgi:tRNA (cmo5U34)-methyltransferase